MRADQLAGPTPCRDWDVTALLTHLIGGHEMFAAALGQPAPPVDAADDPSVTVLATRYRTAAAASLDAFAAPGALQRVVGLPMGEVPGEVALGMALTGAVVHGWDLRRPPVRTARSTSGSPARCWPAPRPRSPTSSASPPGPGQSSRNPFPLTPTVPPEKDLSRSSAGRLNSGDRPLSRGREPCHPCDAGHRPPRKRWVTTSVRARVPVVVHRRVVSVPCRTAPWTAARPAPTRPLTLQPALSLRPGHQLPAAGVRASAVVIDCETTDPPSR